MNHLSIESWIFFLCVLTSIIDKADITHCSSRIIASILQECQKAVLRFGPFYLGYSTMCPTCYLLVKYLTMLLLWLSKKRAAVWSSAFWLQTHWRLARCCCVTPTLAKKKEKKKKLMTIHAKTISLDCSLGFLKPINSDCFLSKVDVGISWLTLGLGFAAAAATLPAAPNFHLFLLRGGKEGGERKHFLGWRSCMSKNWSNSTSILWSLFSFYPCAQRDRVIYIPISFPNIKLGSDSMSIRWQWWWNTKLTFCVEGFVAVSHNISMKNETSREEKENERETQQLHLPICIV